MFLEPYLVNGINNPVNAGVPTDGFMLRVNKNDLEILVCGILIDPVRVQNPQVCASPPNTFLSCRPEGPLVFELVNTLVGGFSYRPTVALAGHPMCR
jgi:hypothetical protein